MRSRSRNNNNNVIKPVSWIISKANEVIEKNGKFVIEYSEKFINEKIIKALPDGWTSIKISVTILKKRTPLLYSEYVVHRMNGIMTQEQEEEKEHGKEPATAGN